MEVKFLSSKTAFAVINNELKEIKLIKTTFNDGVPMYDIELKGGERIKTCINHFYENESDFKAGRFLPLAKGEIERQRYFFENGEPVLKECFIKTFDNVKCAYEIPGYADRAEALLYNDYVVENEDGTKTTRRCPYNKVKLSDKQNEIVDRFMGLINEMKENNIKVFHEVWYDKMYFANVEDTKVYDSYREDVKDCAISVSQILRTEDSCIGTLYSDGECELYIDED